MPTLRTLRAITREVSRSLADCELTHVARQPIDVDVARRQHDAYEAALARAGCAVERLAEEPAHPDAVFVEDTALVLDEVAVALRPGAASRQGEVASVAAALAPYREVRRMTGPGTIDGGDLLLVGRTLFVGLSSRSDEAGIAELATLLAPHGYQVRGVALAGCLHLKTAATAIADDTVLVQPRWIDGGALGARRVVEVDPAEPFAANALRVGGRLIYPATCPATADRLEALGYVVDRVDLSELAKAEGAVTCCSLVFTA
jgi:dimethylargininase